MKTITGFTLLLLLLLSPTLAKTQAETQAEMYKSVDAEGNIVYSDKETPEAEKIIPDAINTIPMPKYVPKKPEEPEEVTEASYTSFKITSPANDASVRGNNGVMQVTLSSKPKLDVSSGHSVTVFIDGKAVVKNAKRMSISVSNIDRGSHRLSASIRNKSRKTLIKSKSVVFHMLRRSVPRPATR